jgi:hypothetical protein
VGDKYLEVRQSIPDIFESNHRCYGYRRLQASLTRQDVAISEKVVLRLMKQESLVVPKPWKRWYASYLGEVSPAPANLINRDFQAAVPNEKWLTDITEFQIPAGKVYLSPIIDCFDGMAVSWTIGTSPDAELVNTMLDAAIETVLDRVRRLISVNAFVPLNGESLTDLAPPVATALFEEVARHNAGAITLPFLKSGGKTSSTTPTQPSRLRATRSAIPSPSNLHGQGRSFPEHGRTAGGHVVPRCLTACRSILAFLKDSACSVWSSATAATNCSSPTPGDSHTRS